MIQRDQRILPPSNIGEKAEVSIDSPGKSILPPLQGTQGYSGNKLNSDGTQHYSVFDPNQGYLHQGD